MNFLHKLFKKKEKRDIVLVWEDFEKNIPISKEETRDIIYLLNERNKQLIQKNIELQKYISDMQRDFEFSQSRLISKINS